ncbi:MAG: 8-amino-7-oxononanoate synthase [Candidatus Omnitrophica bacterium]|nr:8-amino-7-oxononanoate synthase [Candidatus Omnitrophota bacterium]
MFEKTENMSWIENELKALKEDDLYRKLRSLQLTRSGVRAVWQDRELTLFCSNDYLGLAHHPRMIQALKKAVEQSGAGAGASQLISGHSQIHQEFAAQTAVFKRKEAALIYGSGYLANLGAISALAAKEDLIVMDKLCHASLIDGARLSGAMVRVFPHKRYERCEELIKNAPEAQKKWIISDTVFSMDGDSADISELIRIKEMHGAMLLLDDAHGTGVFGLEGRGACEDQGLEPGVDVLTGTFSKAIGILGGFVCASAAVVDYLVNKSRPFIFATALPPALCAAGIQAIEIIRDSPEIRRKLWRNIQKLHEGLSGAGWQTGPIHSPIMPVIVHGEKEALAISEKLLERNLLVPAVRYPAVAKGQARLRVTVSAEHDEEDIRNLVYAFNTLTQR